jgi:glycosyltransferase involved in cell wall biosynthesis
MRVLHINERAGFVGGVERILHDIAAGLSETGHPQALLYTEPAAQPAFLAPFRDSAAGQDNARALIARFDPDVVLIHKLADETAVEWLSELRPTVRMIHDHDLVCLRRHKYFPIGTRICELPAGVGCYTHLCFVDRAAAGSRLPVRLRRVGERKRAIRAHARVRRFIVGSRWMQRELTVNGIDAGRIDIVPPVPKSLAAARVHPPSDEPEILYVGQVIRGKGVDLLLRALQGVRRPWHATVVGAGNHLDACRGLAERLGIAERVEFAGWVDHEALESYFARAALTAVPSRWPEPFGMVGIEAMARGRPVVAFAAGGITDWLQDDVNGLIAPAADVDALRARIDRLLGDPPFARKLGEQAALGVAERYRPEDFLRRMNDTLARAAAGADA